MSASVMVNNGQSKNQNQEEKVMFCVSAAELKKALAIMKKGMDRKSSLPVLNGVHISLDKYGKLSLHRTNLEVNIVRTFMGRGHEVEPFDVVVEDANLFEKTVASFKKADVNGWIETEEYEATSDTNASKKVKKQRQTLVLSDGKNEVRFNCVQEGPRDFPAFPDLPHTVFKIGVPDLRDALALTLPFAAEDETRPLLHTVNFKFHDNKLHLAATDGYRLGWYRDVWVSETNAPLPFSVNLPVKTCRVLQEVLKDTVEVKGALLTNHNWMFFRTDHYLIFSQLVDGNYPDYNTIIPKHHNTEVEVDAVEMLQVVKAVEPMVKDSSDITVFTLVNNGTADEDKFEVAPKEGTGNKSKWNLTGDVVGANLQIAFNAHYLKDAFAAFGKQRVRMEFNTPASPMLVHVNDNAVHVLMPMHITR